jgi:exportin-2 (importin alpha re-exporter)
MVCSALGVLTCIAKMEQHAHMFANESTMSNMCRDIALPNIAIRGNASIDRFIYLFI